LLARQTPSIYLPNAKLIGAAAFCRVPLERLVGLGFTCNVHGFVCPNTQLFGVDNLVDAVNNAPASFVNCEVRKLTSNLAPLLVVALQPSMAEAG